MKQISKVFIALLLVVSVLAPSFGALAAPAAAVNNHVVRASSPDWAVAVDSGSGVDGPAAFVSGPATPPLGSGSFNVQLNSAAVGIVLLAQKYQGTKLAEIATLTYSTYGNSTTQAISFQINYDPDVTTVEAGTWYGRLVYEPYQNGHVVLPTNTWISHDMINGGTGLWWATGNANSPVDDVCTIGSPCTWDHLIATWPNIGIRNDANTGIMFKAGSAWNGFNGNVDNFTFELSGGDTDIYDFEPETQCTTTCYVNTATGNDAFGGDSPTSAKKTIQAAINQVSVNGTVQMAAGTYNENVVINKNGITLSGAVALNPNDVANPATHTIIDGASGPAVGTSPGININSGITDVTIENLRVQAFGSSSGIHGAPGNNGLTIQNVHVYNNNAANAYGAGIWINGPVNGVTINNVDAQFNRSRGIVVWNGFKQNITITNNYVANNNCCGIELQDGTASGVTISGNTVINNADSGIATIGLMAGAGPNVISNNTVTDNGRFGIEIKLPDGSGAASGDGSIVVENNTVSLTTTPADLRDYAGIAVIRRAWLASSGNVDVPTGVIVRNNNVSGYVQSNGSSNSTGFGIVVEGLDMQVLNNTLTGNDVGVQVQAGHLPYTANSNVDGDQSNLSDAYFGRGNSPVACAAVSGNTYTSNTVDFRRVGLNATDCAAMLSVPSTLPADNILLTSVTSELTVEFSEDVVHDGSADAADNVANYLLVEQGVNGTFDTLSCVGGLVSDDVPHAIATATYDNNGGAGPFTATLTPASPLTNGVYRLFICGTTSIWSTTGVELNGGASDTTVTFTVAIPATGPTTPSTTASSLPATGFAPAAVTQLPLQPAELAYSATDLTLRIPTLGLSTSIVGVPQTNGGEWDVTWLGRSVGYLNGTAFPTYLGNTVLTAHVWGADNQPGPFYGLEKLAYGEQFTITAWGNTYTYEVRGNDLYNPRNVRPLNELGGYDWVTLITCHGFDATTGTYQFRRVVRAVLVSVD